MAHEKFGIDYSEVIALLNSNRRVATNALPESADSFLVSELFESNDNSTILFITSDQKDAERVVAEINSQRGIANCAKLFPVANSVPYNMRSPFGPIREARLEVLNSLISGEKSIIVAPSTAVFEPVILERDLFSKTVRISQNDEVEIPKLLGWLDDLGFKREATVAEPGAFSVKGGIVDIYPFGTDNPIRIEFWGDVIDSIREFDIFKQKSLKAVSSINIMPMKEFLPSTDERNDALERIEKYLIGKRISDKYLDMLIHSWSSVSETDGLEWFRHWFLVDSGQLLDYIPKNSLVIRGDYLNIAERYERIIENYSIHKKRVPDLQAPFLSEPEDLIIPPSKITKILDEFPSLYLNAIPKNTPSVRFDFINQPSFGGDISLFINDLHRKNDEGFTVTVFGETRGHLSRLAEQLVDKVDRMPNMVEGYLKSGFFSLKQRFAIISESLIFDRTAQRKFSAKTKQSAPIVSYDALNRGDFVVHIDHGIGKYLGIEDVKIGDYSQDCMVIEYKDSAKIRVPITDFHKVQKYIGKDSHAPALSKLGSSAWEKKKERTRRALQEMAGQLIKLYAKREFNKGIMIGEDSKWQKEFEDAFLYTPTVDQDKSWVSIKSDMESERPMDRLVCGDVGFGKTEVAMRAAFKAVMDGYQVAILAPTTVLASQHGISFTERMADFPVNIKVLSRVTDGKAGRKIREEIASGDLNIIIGTHKILSKTIKYSNLGLVVIDEEQRFGVKQKERFTELRHSVNLLSMSATPIPRTLHMSMAGVRDLSVISTPPRNRIPVDTTVCESHDDIFQRAILDEIERGGQVFVVLNRITGLDELYYRIEKLVPTAKVCVAHGQMDGEIVSDIMRSFTAGDYDVLLSTTIIENGIDISNANTIIVEKSDRLGLSQLYQLRGRVGRSGEQAYAYFFVDSFKSVKEQSIKRLKALEQFTDLGSGFQLAMRDLELRGAGNLRGTDQSGSIAAVGFELYCQLLKEEMDRLRDRVKGDNIIPDCEVKIKLNGYFPANYVSDSNMRIVLYQRCTSLKTFEEIKEFESEVVDRFGSLPLEVLDLLLFMEIKIYGRRFSISEISISSDRLSFILGGGDKNIQEATAIIMGLKNGNFKLKYGDTIKLVAKIKSGEPSNQGRVVKNILKKALYSAK